MIALSTMALLSFASPLSFADAAWECKSQTAGGEIAVRFNYEALPKPGRFSSIVHLNGTEVPSPHPICYISTRPSTRYVLCTHIADGLRIELYPISDKATGDIKSARAIIWRGKQVQEVNLSNCIAAEAF